MHAQVKEIAAVEPAETTQVAEYRKTAAALHTLRIKFKDAVFAVETTAGMKAARESRAEIKAYRVDIEKTRKEIKAPALERCRLIDDEARRITAELEALENPIDRQIKAEEARKEAEQKARAEAEKARVAKINERISRIRNAPALFVGRPSTMIRDAKAKIEAFDATEEEFAEFVWEAKAAKHEAMARLSKLLEDTEKKEAEDRRIAEEHEELSRLRAEAEARKAEDERRLADERRAHELRLRAEREEAERIEAEKRRELEAEERRLATERDEIERRRREVEQQEARARVERERFEREQSEQAARAAAEREKKEHVRERLEAIEAATVSGTIDVGEALAQAYRLGQDDMARDLNCAGLALAD